jgi:hypothetical protein
LSRGKLSHRGAGARPLAQGGAGAGDIGGQALAQRRSRVGLLAPDVEVDEALAGGFEAFDFGVEQALVRESVVGLAESGFGIVPAAQIGQNRAQQAEREELRAAIGLLR